MSAIQNNATRYDGVAVDYVMIFKWESGECLKTVTPNNLGDWSYVYYTNQSVGITYVSSGCQPITHGPYEIISTGHRYWRIINVITQGSGDVLNAMEGGDLRLVNEEMFITNNPSKTISSGGYGGDYDPLGAFDDSKNFAAKPDANGVRWIGYDFGVNVNVNSIAVSMHRNPLAPVERNWVSVDVEYSDDAITWDKKGTAYFNIVGKDKTMHTSVIE